MGSQNQEGRAGRGNGQSSQEIGEHHQENHPADQAPKEQKGVQLYLIP